MNSPNAEVTAVKQRSELDWTPVREVAGKLLEVADQLADNLLNRQRQEVPGLDPSLASEGSQTYIRWLVRTFLSSVGERRPPTWDQLACCEEFGASRAEWGFESRAMLVGYHLAYRDLYQHMIEEVLQRSDVSPAVLAATFAHGQQWLNAVVEATCRGFESQDADTRSTRERVTHQFVTMLEAAEDVTEGARSLATGLGFDPEGQFVAIHGHPPLTTDDPMRTSARPITRVIQAGDAEAVLGPAQEGERWGIGARRPGLAGARRSILDAKLAYAATPETGGRVDFVESWCLCLPQAHREALDPIMDTARNVARSRPHLHAAVVAYGDTHFCVSAAARVLQIHPNTLSYRLDQWRQLTGLNPYTVTGLVHSFYVLR